MQISALKKKDDKWTNNLKIGSNRRKVIEKQSPELFYRNL